MSPIFQVAGAPSVTARLRREKPAYSQSRVGKPENLGPANVWPKKSQNSSSKLMNSGEYFSNNKIDLGPRSRAHAMTPKPAFAYPSLPDNNFFENDSTKESKPHSYYKQSLAGNPEQVPMGRCLDWERPGCTLSSSSNVNKYSVKFNHSYPKPSDYSISYERRASQTPMEQAGNCEYLPFPRSEFKVGTIVRMNVHEPDFKGTSKPAILKASQAPTLVAGGPSGKRRKEHRHHGDFGPIYSENRICIVVNVAKSCYFAVPLFTHEGKGLAKIDPGEREDWVSVEDHRKLGHCQQQSEHRPLRTAYMSPHANILDAVSTAWIPYGFPCRFDVPVAYQGKLDKASAERLGETLYAWRVR